MTRPIAIVISNHKSLDDQWSRSSGNFSTKWFGSCSAMDVEVTVDGRIDNDVSFSMAIDIQNGNDKTIFNEVRNGSRLEFYESNTFYICNVPIQQRKNFMVKLFPVV